LIGCLQVAKGLLGRAFGDFVVPAMLRFHLGHQPFMKVNSGGYFLFTLKGFLTFGYAPVIGMTRYARVFAAKRGLLIVEIKANFERFHKGKYSE
jgi:hypothetical protein